MKVATTILLIICLLLAGVEPASAKAWRDIIPLKSTRADIERLLGPSPEKYVDRYVLKDEVVDIGYEQFPCGHKNPPGWPEAPPGWNVPKDTVVAVRVEPRQRVALASLGIDLSGFKKWQEADDVPQFQVYSKDEEGFAIEVFESIDGKSAVVTAYIYQPTAAEEKAFRCKE